MKNNFCELHQPFYIFNCLKLHIYTSEQYYLLMLGSHMKKKIRMYFSASAKILIDFKHKEKLLFPFRRVCGRGGGGGHLLY